MPLITVSERARRTPASPIRRLTHLAQRANDQGTEVLHLNIGQPDINSPQEFLRSIGEYDDKVVAYEASEGNKALRQAWARYNERTLGLSITAQHYLITTGASEALIFTFMTCCDPGDEVLIFDPTYANYIGFAAISGVSLVPIVTTLEEGFSLPDRKTIESSITTRTRAILLCSPNNPTGTVYTRDELQMLLEICTERNIFFIVDETYREFVYDGLNPLSVFHLEANNPRVIVVDSLSKRFSLCGARIGCIITSNEEVLAKTLNIAQARLSSPTIEQFAAARMLESISPSFVTEVVKTYQSRRDTLCNALATIPGVVTHKPQGAFYTIARFPVDDAESYASFMLSQFSEGGATVFLAPAAGFYMSNGSGAKKVRLAYVIDNAAIERAVKILEAGLKAYSKR